jgi:hypothetical protein
LLDAAPDAVQYLVCLIFCFFFRKVASSSSSNLSNSRRPSLSGQSAASVDSARQSMDKTLSDPLLANNNEAKFVTPPRLAISQHQNSAVIDANKSFIEEAQPTIDDQQMLDPTVAEYMAQQRQQQVPNPYAAYSFQHTGFMSTGASQDFTHMREGSYGTWSSMPHSHSSPLSRSHSSLASSPPASQYSLSSQSGSIFGSSVYGFGSGPLNNAVAPPLLGDEVIDSSTSLSSAHVLLPDQAVISAHLMMQHEQQQQHAMFYHQQVDQGVLDASSGATMAHSDVSAPQTPVRSNQNPKGAVSSAQPTPQSAISARFRSPLQRNGSGMLNNNGNFGGNSFGSFGANGQVGSLSSLGQMLFPQLAAAAGLLFCHRD